MVNSSPHNPTPFTYKESAVSAIYLNTTEPKMSRFFTAGDSSSESGSDEDDVYSEGEADGKSEEESSSEEEEGSDDDSDSSSDSEGGGKTGVSQFLKDHDSSDESEDEEKVTIVKSAKDKRFEELEAVLKLIENAVKINDWSSISTGQSVLEYIISRGTNAQRYGQTSISSIDKL